MKPFLPAATAAFAVAVLASLDMAAAAEPALSVELNKLERQGDSCRTYLVLTNGTDSAFDALKLDLVVFDAEGVVAGRLAVDGAPLPARKTSLEVFDIGGTSCQNIGRLLLNDVLDCRDGSGERTDCLASIRTSAKTPVPFVK